MHLQMHIDDFSRGRLATFSQNQEEKYRAVFIMDAYNPLHSHRTGIKENVTILRFLVILFIGAALFPASLNAQSETTDSSVQPLSLSGIDASGLSINNPTLNLIFDVKDSTYNPVNLELIYLQFDPVDQDANWTDDGKFTSGIEPASMGIYEIQLDASVGSQEHSVSIPKNVVAMLKKHPSIIVGKITATEDQSSGRIAITYYPSEQIDLVHASALAFDNPMYGGGNLAPQIRETVKGIKSASEAKENVLSVVLADSYGENNSQIFFVQNGAIIQAESLFAGLPNSAGLIDSSLTEYDMGNGDVLGGFLKWTNDFSQNQRLSFSYYGHGSAIMPNIESEVDSIPVDDANDENTAGSGPIAMPSWVAVQPSWVAVQPSWVAVQPSWVAVQPSWVAVQPSWVAVQPTWTIAEDHFATDSHPLSLISVKDIARAVQVGSNHGEKPLAVLDLVHCFSLSVEQVHELAPYAESIVGSANYHFFDSRMPGNALADLTPTASSLDMADEIMQSYDQTLPETGYPRTMAVIDGNEVQDIKTYWDQASAEIMNAFEQDHSGTRSKLQAAYQQSTKYDSTSCDNNFALKSPDALVDFYEFAAQLETQFPDNLALMQAANLTSSQIDAAIYSTVNNSGNPWFGTSVDDHWNFSGKGLSIFADMQGMVDPNSQSVALSWQTAFYNRLPTDLHPTPFDFLQSENDGKTWADVIEKTWAGYEVYPQSCLVTIPPDHDSVEVAIRSIGSKAAPRGDRWLKADIQTDAQLGNLIVLFEVVHGNEVVYSEMVYTGWLDAGEHTVMSARTMSSSMLKGAKESGLTLRVTIDPFDYLIEKSKEDNHMAQNINH